MPITATHIAYLHTCRRKLWLYDNGIQMEHSSDTVAMGKHIGETSYGEKAKKYKEVQLLGSKIDRYDPKTATLHEVKKSNRLEPAHIAQVKYYIYLLRKAGIPIKKAILDYPKQKINKEIDPESVDDNEIESWVAEAEKITELEECPPLINEPICKKCSYYEFCYAGEPE